MCCLGRTSLRSVIVLALSAIGGTTAQAQQLRLPESLYNVGPPRCYIVADADANALADAAASFTFPQTARRITHLRRATAGARLLLAGDHADHSIYRVDIRAKSSLDLSAAERVCGPLTWSPANGALEMENRRLGPGSIWQIELTADGSSAGHRIEVTREEGTAADPDAGGGTGVLFGLSCEDWEPTKPTVYQQKGFAAKVRLDVSAPPVDNDLSDTQKAELTTQILQSAALWVSACRECLPEHLSAIEVDGRLFLRAALARWIAERARVQPLTPQAVDATLDAALENEGFLNAGKYSTPKVKALEAYVPAETIARELADFCDHPAEASALSTLTKVHIALCQPELLPPIVRARIVVRLRPDGATYCGTDPEIIACRADVLLTEINTRDYRFRLNALLPAVGHGKVELELLPVLAHELGHWIGLGHLNSGGSIMSASAEQARCIDEATVAALLLSLKTKTIEQPQAFRLHARTR